MDEENYKQYKRRIEQVLRQVARHWSTETITPGRVDAPVTRRGCRRLESAEWGADQRRGVGCGPDNLGKRLEYGT
jgi:hypothetical protein